MLATQQSTMQCQHCRPCLPDCSQACCTAQTHPCMPEANLGAQCHAELPLQVPAPVSLSQFHRQLQAADIKFGRHKVPTLICRHLSWVRDTPAGRHKHLLDVWRWRISFHSLLGSMPSSCATEATYLMQWAPAAVVAAVLPVSDSAMVIIAILDFAVVMVAAAASQLCEQSQW